MGAVDYPAGIEVLDLFTLQAEREPRMPGSPHSALPDLWVFETPSAIKRLPRIAVVYTIDDANGFVDLWNLYRL